MVSVDNLFLYLDFTRRIHSRQLFCLFEIHVQFPGLGALLFLVLLDTLLNVLLDQSRLLLGLPGTWRATPIRKASSWMASD